MDSESMPFGIKEDINESSEPPPDLLIIKKTTKKELFVLQSTKIFFLILGMFFTYLVLIFAYGDEALVKLFKGISIQNFIEIITDLNITELLVWFYFIGLFVVLYYVNNSVKQKYFFPHLDIKQQLLVSSVIGYFREGSFTFPFVIMVAFPLVLQIIVPGLINIVAVVELMIPFIVMAELYRISEGSLIKLFQNKNQIKQEPRLILESFMGVILAFPLGVFLLIESGLVRFLHLVHYLLLWPNPKSPVAIIFWDFLNNTISINSLISSFFEASFGNVVIKYYIVTFIVLVITSKLYLILKQVTRTHAIRQIERFVLTYH